MRHGKGCFVASVHYRPADGHPAQISPGIVPVHFILAGSVSISFRSYAKVCPRSDSSLRVKSSFSANRIQVFIEHVHSTAFSEPGLAVFVRSYRSKVKLFLWRFLTAAHTSFAEDRRCGIALPRTSPSCVDYENTVMFPLLRTCNNSVPAVA